MLIGIALISVFPVRPLLFVEALGQPRRGRAGHVRGARAAEATADLERRLDDGVGREAQRDRFEYVTLRGNKHRAAAADDVALCTQRALMVDAVRLREVHHRPLVAAARSDSPLERDGFEPSVPREGPTRRDGFIRLSSRGSEAHHRRSAISNARSGRRSPPGPSPPRRQRPPRLGTEAGSKRRLS